MECPKEVLEPDPAIESEIKWVELINQRLDMTEVNKSWLDDYKERMGFE